MNTLASSLIVKLVCIALPALLLPGLHAAEAQFRLIAESIEIAERGKVPGYALLVDGKRMSFMSPAGWSVKPDAAKKTVRVPCKIAPRKRTEPALPTTRRGRPS